MLFEFEFDCLNCDTHLCSRFVSLIIVTGEKLIHKTESDGCFLICNFFAEWFLALSAGRGLGFLAVTSSHFAMFKFEIADVPTVVAEAQGNRSLGDFVAARVGEPVPSEMDESDFTDQPSSGGGKGRGGGKGNRVSAAVVGHCVACDNPRKSGSTWCAEHKRGYDTIYKAALFKQNKLRAQYKQTNPLAKQTK